jgi:hypothetical protein
MDKRYKIFLCNWFVSGFPGSTLSKVALGLREKSCDITYWIGSRPPDGKEFPGTIFHQNSKAVLGYPAGEVDTRSFEPPGQDILEKLFECESTTLSLMDRMDFSNAPFHRRKRLYYDLVQYWHGVLTSMKPDAVVFYIMPSLAHSYVLYSLAKILGIKTVLCLPIQRGPNSHRILITSDIKNGSDKLIKELSRTGNIRFEDLSEDIRDYYMARTEPKEKIQFTDIAKRVIRDSASKRSGLRKIPSLLLRLVLSFINGTFFKKVKSRFYSAFFGRSRLVSLGKNYIGIVYWEKMREWRKEVRGFRNEYKLLQTEVDLRKKFVFVGLHYQPESSTSPAGGVFKDQLLMIDILSYSMPPDWVIYVKEHPIQWVEDFNQTHLGRYKGYYREIASKKNVFLVPASLTSDKFIEKCQAVATISGTLGAEAIYRGKPVLVFGYPPYKECGEMLKVWDVESCRAAIEKVRSGYRPDKQSVLDYLGGLDRAGIRMWLDARREDKTLVEGFDGEREKSVKDIVDGVYFEIQK